MTAPTTSTRDRATYDRAAVDALYEVVLEPGCKTLPYDAGPTTLGDLANSRRSALDGEAIEAWTTVIARPEPELVVCNLGRRDAPEDLGLPHPTHRRDTTGALHPLDAEPVALNDQHLRFRVAADTPLGTGDLLRCAVSHPCGAFDRWRVIPVVDHDGVITDAILTYF